MAKSNAPRSLPASVSPRRLTLLFAADIRAGTVRRILRDCEPARIPISAVRPASRRQPSKVAVFVDFLALLAQSADIGAWQRCAATPLSHGSFHSASLSAGGAPERAVT